jgi:hypothetical protein
LWLFLIFRLGYYQPTFVGSEVRELKNPKKTTYFLGASLGATHFWCTANATIVVANTITANFKSALETIFFSFKSFYQF